jgi:hypothetical protein
MGDIFNLIICLLSHLSLYVSFFFLALERINALILFYEREKCGKYSCYDEICYFNIYYYIIFSF